MSKDKAPAKRKSALSANGIVRLIESRIKLFHTPSCEPYVSFQNRGHWETCRIKSAEFTDWLSACCYFNSGMLPTQNALAQTVSLLAGHALHSSPERQVHVRVAGHGAAIYLDLANESWEVVKITADRWEIVPDAPISFVRTPGMRSLAQPVPGGSIEELRQFLNIKNEIHFKLTVAWLIAAMRPTGPFPIGILEGTHGSAKSSAARILRSLIDPNSAPLRSGPKNERDLMISAANAWCLGFDNLSCVKPWFSDALCRLSTGSGFSTRSLYTNDAEKIFEGMRPILLNGIDIGIDREDLMDRSISISLSPISEESRKTEAEFWDGFEKARPRVHGSLLTAVVCALRRETEIKMLRLPRMADFAKWVCAAEPGLGWPEGSILEAYRQNREELNGLALENSPFVVPLVCLADAGPWSGTPTELYTALGDAILTQVATEEQASLPRTPQELSHDLRRLAPNLAQIGITVEFGRTAGSNSVRVITIRKTGDAATHDS